jgi:hypothetical protein
MRGTLNCCRYCRNCWSSSRRWFLTALVLTAICAVHWYDFTTFGRPITPSEVNDFVACHHPAIASPTRCCVVHDWTGERTWRCCERLAADGTGCHGRATRRRAQGGAIGTVGDHAVVRRVVFCLRGLLGSRRTFLCPFFLLLYLRSIADGVFVPSAGHRSVLWLTRQLTGVNVCVGEGARQSRTHSWVRLSRE